MPTTDQIRQAADAAKAGVLAIIDAVAAKSPVEWQPAFMALRQEVEANANFGPTLIADTLTALGAAFRSGDFGPADHSDSDLA